MSSKRQKSCYWGGHSYGLVPQIKLHPNSCQYALINYLVYSIGTEDICETITDTKFEVAYENKCRIVQTEKCDVEYDTKCETVTDCSGNQQDDSNGGGYNGGGDNRGGAIGGGTNGGALDFYGVPAIPRVSTEYLLDHRKFQKNFPGLVYWLWVKELFCQRSHYISNKFSLHKPSENPWKYY